MLCLKNTHNKDPCFMINRLLQSQLSYIEECHWSVTQEIHQMHYLLEKFLVVCLFVCLFFPITLKNTPSELEEKAGSRCGQREHLSC